MSYIKFMFSNGVFGSEEINLPSISGCKISLNVAFVSLQVLHQVHSRDNLYASWKLRNLKMKSTKRFLTLVLIFLLTGCGTVSGLGDDLKKASEWTKDKLSK